MSGNQKQSGTGGPQTQRYANSPYQPILPQTISFTGAEFHAAQTFVPQSQPPNPGQGLRNVQPPNQSSTPPNPEIKVANIPSQIQGMQFLPNQTVRNPFYQRGAGLPQTAPRMQGQQHRGAQGPPPMFTPQGTMYMYLQQPPQAAAQIYYNQRSQNIIPQPTFPPQVYSQQLPTYQFSSPPSSGVPSYQYPMFPAQPAGIALTNRTAVTPATPSSNSNAANIQHAPLMAQPPLPTSYPRSNQRQRRPKAISIIDPVTGEDMLKEFFETENSSSHPASGESSARQTPQPVVANNTKEIQADFAKQVAQAINEDLPPATAPVEQMPSMHEVLPQEHFHHPPPPVVQMQPQVAPIRYDVQNSNLQYDAKEFVCSASKSKDSTPIVSANSDAVEVILPKKDRDSPVKSRKQSQRDPKPSDNSKDEQCDKPTSSIVKEDTSTNVPKIEAPASTPDPIPTVVAKDPVKDNVVDKKGAKKAAAVPVEHKSSEPETTTHQSISVDATGKSKNSRNKHNVNAQNGKSQAPAPQAPQPSLVLPQPQPPKANNRSNKSKELNLKGANKEGTDMDAFNDNTTAKVEINANIMPAVAEKVANNNAVNDNSVLPPVQPVAANNIKTESEKDTNENNISVMKPDNVNVAPMTNTATPAAPVPPVKPPGKVFDVVSIVRDQPPKSLPPFEFATRIANDSRDETDKALLNDKQLVSSKNELNSKPADGGLRNLPYAPGQWTPAHHSGLKVYQPNFLLALRDAPASRQKPENIPDSVLLDERNRGAVDPRLAMGGRTDFANLPYPNYGGGKSGSQRGALPKRNSQSGKMGSRGGDKSMNKAVPKVSISLRGDVKLHQSENAWKPTRLNKGDEVSEEYKITQDVLKKMRSILNKLTPQKFETLVDQVRMLKIDTKDRLQGVINLVFDKAIDEPNFSFSYASMCKEIQNMQVSVDTGEKKDEKKEDKKTVAFRTLLVGRCQNEFEKNSVDESQRNGKLQEIEECTDPEKKKELLFDLEEYDRRLRLKSVGTIRFIGELFKQQMLTSSIMRRCLQTLLDNKDEESLECLCKLLTTIGKELEEKKVDFSSIFEEMKLITEGKRQKVSSRIRFMLQDVIELRDSKWVPRRGDTNPKTMDQIQKEAEKEQLNIQVMNMAPRKDDRNNGPRSGGNSRLKVSEDGWSSVGGNRNNRSQQFSIQTDKMKINKMPLENEPLGSSHMFGNWSKGSGAHKNSQPTSLTTNMYSALDTDFDRRAPSSRGKEYNSKGHSMERTRNYDGRGSRSGSQHRDSSTPMRSTGPPLSSAMLPPPNVPLSQPKLPPQPYQAPAAQVAPVAPAAPAVPELTEEQIERRIRNSLDEYITGCCSAKEYFQDISASVPADSYHKVVYESYNYILEKSQSARLKTGQLFSELIKTGKISVDCYIKGFEELLELWQDLEIDIPQIWQYFAEDIGPLLCEEVMSIAQLKQLLNSLIQQKQAKKLLPALFKLVVKEKGPNFLQNYWQSAKIGLSEFMPTDEVESFVTENNLQFLLGGESPVGQTPLNYEAIQKKLSEFFAGKAQFDDVVNWISANVGDRVKEKKFVRTLATAIFEASIVKNKLQQDRLSALAKLLHKYVDNNPELEVQCLYALQELINRLEHPQGLLLAICDMLYEDSTFCHESFIMWEASTDPAEQAGKGVAIKQLTSFFTQLKENDEEEDDYSSSEDA